MRGKLVKSKYAMGAALAVMSAAAVWAIAAGTAASAPARTTASAGTATVLENQLAVARAATAKYANNLALAKANGYGIITKMIPTMGYHFMNPNVKGFDIRKPPILVYEHRGRLAARRDRVGLHREACEGTAPRRDLRRVRRGLPLQGRNVLPGHGAEQVPRQGPGHRCSLQLLAPEPGDDARLALVPEPDRPVREHEPARDAVQRRLGAPDSGAGHGPGSAS